MVGMVAATLIYFLALDNSGKPIGKPQAGSRCWRIQGCRSWVRGKAICARRKRRELRRCKLGTEVR
jgi:hypothetical protein